MKVGDVVRQGDRVIKFKGRRAPKRSKHLGIVVAIHELGLPRESETQKLKDMMEMLGRRVDVLWESGKLTKGFAEHSLEVVIDELTDEQLEVVHGGLGKEAFDMWRSGIINESG